LGAVSIGIAVSSRTSAGEAAISVLAQGKWTAVVGVIFAFIDINARGAINGTAVLVISAQSVATLAEAGEAAGSVLAFSTWTAVRGIFFTFVDINTRGTIAILVAVSRLACAHIGFWITVAAIAF
jgi:hypothetical protein